MAVTVRSCRVATDDGGHQIVADDAHRKGTVAETGMIWKMNQPDEVLFLMRPAE